MTIDNRLGDPDPTLVQPLQVFLPKQFGLTGYGNERKGDPELCRLIAEDFSEFYSTSITADEVMIGSGARGVTTAALKYIRDRYNEEVTVLLPSPYYKFYTLQMDDLGIKYKIIDIGPHAEVKASDLEEFLKKDSPQILLINNPVNPTGDVFPDKFMRDMLGLMEDYPMLNVLSDSVYDRITRPGVEVTNLYAIADDNLRGRIFDVNSASKRISYPALRLGALICKDAREVFMTERFSSEGPASIHAQAFYKNIISETDYFAEYARQVNLIYDYKITLTHSLLAEISEPGVKIPDGGIYYWFRPKADVGKILQAAESEGILLANGADFGDPSSIRISCGASADELVEICKSIRRSSGVAELPDHFTKPDNSQLRVNEQRLSKTLSHKHSSRQPASEVSHTH